MKFKLKFNPEFYDDLIQAIDWYNEQQPGLGSKFYSSVKKQVTQLNATAFNYSIRYDDIRCLPLKTFPYMVHYQIDIENKIVKIEALFHTSRDPSVWKKR